MMPRFPFAFGPCFTIHSQTILPDEPASAILSVTVPEDETLGTRLFQARTAITASGYCCAIVLMLPDEIAWLEISSGKPRPSASGEAFLLQRQVVF